MLLSTVKRYRSDNNKKEISDAEVKGIETALDDR